MQNKKSLFSYFASAAVLFAPVLAVAMDSTEVLPESISSPSVRMGIVSGIGTKFMSNGNLMSLGETNSVEFDAKALTDFEPRVKQLVSVLNQFGNQRMGDALSLGVLHVNTVPEVRYFAPVFAHGLTANWTIGFGVPVLQYRNKLSFSQTGSNISAIRAKMGDGIPEVTAAFDQLDVPLVDTAQSFLAKKGYKAIADRNEDQLGDLQLVSLYQFGKGLRTSAQWKAIVSLPTGKGDDPDDLADLGAFGYTSVENILLGNYIVNGNLFFALKGGYRYTLPDQVLRRIPLNEADTLPDADTKDTVERQTGGAVLGGGSVNYTVAGSINLAAGYEITKKFGDTFGGNHGKRYDLLVGNKDSVAEKIRLGVSYSSVESFFAGKAWLPTMIAYEFSDTIRGINTERMTVHEVWLQLFF